MGAFLCLKRHASRGRNDRCRFHSVPYKCHFNHIPTVSKESSGTECLVRNGTAMPGEQTGSKAPSSSLFRRTSQRLCNALKIGRDSVPTPSVLTPPASPRTPSDQRRDHGLRLVIPEAHIVPKEHSRMQGNRSEATPPDSPVSPWSTVLQDDRKSPQSVQGALSQSHQTNAKRSFDEVAQLRLPADNTDQKLSGDTGLVKVVSEEPETPTSSYSVGFSSTGTCSQPSTAKTTPNHSGSGSSSGTIVHRVSSHNQSLSASTAGSSAMERIEEHLKGFWRLEEQEDPNLKRTIFSVEVISAYKIYMENHYHSLMRESPRNLRRRSLEKKMQMLNLPRAERGEYTQSWLKSESNNLRERRTTNRYTRKKSTQSRNMVGGFEVIRVLGKGSFGTVQLVRKQATTIGTPQACPTMINGDHIGLHNHTVQETSSTSIVTAAAAEASRQVPVTKLKKHFFAMKTIRKSAMLLGAQEGHLRAERDFLVLAEGSEWVVPLVAAFEDNTNLYLVMDYMIGGDFLGLLLREDVLDERAAAFYIAEMILCVEESHKMGWIHRDVKPDNFLIDQYGHLKISDFGLSFDGHWSHSQKYYDHRRQEIARDLGITVLGDLQDREQELRALDTDQRIPASTYEDRKFTIPTGEKVIDHLERVHRRRYANSVVGTSQYMAPEVVRGDQYDGRCDWWSIGIILYECLFGKTPFYSENRFNTKEKILRHPESLRFPLDTARVNQPFKGGRSLPLPPVTHLAVELISQLLVERQWRLSCPRYQANDRTLSARQAHCPSEVRRSTSASAMYQRANGSSRTPRAWSGSCSNGLSFLYPDDAREIKAHPFFRYWGINFKHMHSQAPPCPPRFRDEESITKYFDDEHDIMSECEGQLDESSDDSEILEIPRTLIPKPGAAAGGGAKVKSPAGTTSFKGPLDEALSPNNKPTQAAQQPRKRARDKILRDIDVGRTAMALRKRKGFLGYTYRRPERVVPTVGGDGVYIAAKAACVRPSVLAFHGEGMAPGDP